MIQPVRSEGVIAHSVHSKSSLQTVGWVVCSQKHNCKMRVRFDIVLLLLTAALVHGDQQAATKGAGMVIFSVSKLHVHSTCTVRSLNTKLKNTD